MDKKCVEDDLPMLAFNIPDHRRAGARGWCDRMFRP